MSRSSPGGPVLGHAGTHCDWLLDCGKLREAEVKGEAKGGFQILFKPFVIYTGIYLSLKINNGMCGTIRSVENKNRHFKWELCSCTGFLSWCKYGTTSILACFLHSHGENVEFSPKILPNESSLCCKNNIRGRTGLYVQSYHFCNFSGWDLRVCHLTNCVRP